MTTRDEIIAGIRQVDERLAALRERILAQGEQPLAAGEWTVRDALSHMAARGNGVDRVVQRLRLWEAGQPFMPPRTTDEINAGQVEERTSASVAELLEEIRVGHAAAIAALEHVDDATLAKEMPQGFRPGDAPVADLIVRGGPAHDGGHLDEIEAVLA
ncbi:MAG: maleylpyruvate isomerase N-terminal domain-containing protein [Dehalococcoidia bacterium]